MASLHRTVKCLSGATAGLLRQRLGAVTHQSCRNYPVCTIETNLASANLPREVHFEFEEVLAKTLNKPQSACSVTVVPDVKISRDGSDEPCLSVQIWSIGVFDEERNFYYAKKFYDYLLPKFNIPYDRIQMLFHPIERHNAGHLLYKQYKEQRVVTSRAQ